MQDIHLDYSRQKATPSTMDKLFDLARASKLRDKIKALTKLCPSLFVWSPLLDIFNPLSDQAMTDGEHINVTENRAVLHVALRARPEEKYMGTCLHLKNIYIS